MKNSRRYLIIFCFLVIWRSANASDSTDCEREQGRHCHQKAQCERRQGDPRPRCYCSPGYGGDGYNCHRKKEAELKRCNPPNNVQHGWFSTSDGSHKVGSKISYQCQHGYELIGGESRTCQQDGKWSGTSPTCERIVCKGKCGVPHHMGNGVVAMNRGCAVGNKVGYRCQKGMTIVGSKTRTCMPSGHWSGVQPRCEKATDCERENGKHCHKWAQCERRQEDKKPRCYCSPGYSGDGHNCRERQEDECVRRNQRRCHAQADCQRLNENEYECRCRSNYKGNGYDCERTGCMQVEHRLPHGRVLSQQWKHTVGSVISYECNEGYVLKGQSQRTCQQNGRWSGVTPTCAEKAIKKSCQRPQNIPHGIMRLNNEKLISGTTVVFECIRGHRMQGNSELRCRNGVWSGTVPTCIPRGTAIPRKRRCQRPADIRNGNFQTSNGDFVHGNTITYQCSTGYRKNGNSQRRCFNGRWSGVAPTCVDTTTNGMKRCDRISSRRIPNGFARVSDKTFKVGSIITFRCKHGWRLHGNVRRICQDNGIWSGAHPTCKKTNSGGSSVVRFECETPCHKWAKCVRRNLKNICVCQAPYFGDGRNCQACSYGKSYRPCPSKCQPSCDNLSPVCATGCEATNKCVCDDDKVRRSIHDATCVERSECQQSK